VIATSSLPIDLPALIPGADVEVPESWVGVARCDLSDADALVCLLLDRIDRQQRRLQFALLPSEEELAAAPRSLRRSKTAATSSGERPHSSPNRSGKKGKTKSKARERNKKSKGKRR